MKATLPALDAGRALAIVGVVCVHTMQIFNPLVNPAHSHTWLVFDRLIGLGKYGVEVFFVISGYLIGYLYSQSFEWRQYAIRRVARIWPLWIAFLLLALIEGAIVSAGPWFQSQAKSAVPSVTAMLLVLSFLGWVDPWLWNTPVPGGWSIQAEVVHYAVFTVVRRLGLVALGLVTMCVEVSGFALRFIESTSNAGFGLQFVTAINRLAITETLPYFFIGLLLAKLAEISWSNLRQLGFGHLFVPGLMWMVVIAVLSQTPVPFGQSKYALAVVAVATVLAFAIQQTPMRAVANWLGKRSYFIYFAHFQCLLAFQFLVSRVGLSIHPNSATSAMALYFLALVLVLAMCAVAAEVSFRFFERPINRWSHRFGSSR